jgi:AraC-like DNA-binding protein
VDGCYPEPLRVADLARAAGLSAAHFSREFRRWFGEPPHAYLVARRLERAAALLVSTDLTILEICTAVGLSSVGSFTTSFRRRYDLTPAAYRAAFPATKERAQAPACMPRRHGRR